MLDIASIQETAKLLTAFLSTTECADFDNGDAYAHTNGANNRAASRPRCRTRSPTHNQSIGADANLGQTTSQTRTKGSSTPTRQRWTTTTFAWSFGRGLKQSCFVSHGTKSS